MKSLLILLAGLGAALLFSSCTDYSTSYHDGGYGSSGYATAQVGIIRTSNSYWGYDPFRRAYYDYRSNRYYNYSGGSYYTSAPRCYTQAVYPSGYRAGRSLSCPTRLRTVHYRGNSNHGHSSSSRYPSSSNHYGRTPSHKTPSQRPPSQSTRSVTPSLPYIVGRGRSSSSQNQPVTIHRSTSSQHSRVPSSRTSSRMQTVQPRPTVSPTPSRSTSSRVQQSRPAPQRQAQPTRSAPQPHPKAQPQSRPSSSRSGGKASRSQRR